MSQKEPDQQWIATNATIGMWMVITISVGWMAVFSYFTSAHPVANGDSLKWLIWIGMILLQGIALAVPVSLGFFLVWRWWKHLHPVYFILLGTLFSLIIVFILSTLAFPFCA